MKRNVLGKGIAAIISNESNLINNSLIEIDIDQIQPNPHQPRKTFDPLRIRELADSMNESGMIQPIVVYRQDDHYCLIVGERRWRAAQLLNWSKIPAVVRDYTENKIVVDSLVENIQRENLNSLEIANGIDALIQIAKLNHQQVGEKLGMSRVAVTNYHRLIKLPDSIKSMIVEGLLDQGHARALLALSTESEMIDFANLIVKKGLSVRKVEDMVKKQDGRTGVKNRTIDPDIDKIENKLVKLFSTKVKVKYQSKGKGNLIIFFNNVDEFQRIFSILFKEQQ